MIEIVGPDRVVNAVVAEQRPRPLRADHRPGDRRRPDRALGRHALLRDQRAHLRRDDRRARGDATRRAAATGARRPRAGPDPRGLRYVWRRPELRMPLLLMAVLGTLGFNFPVIMPLLARYSLRRRRLRLLAADGRDGSRRDHRLAADRRPQGARHERDDRRRRRLRRRRCPRRRGSDAAPRDGRAGAARRRLGALRGLDQLRPAARRRAADARPGDGALLDRLPRLDPDRRPDRGLARRGGLPAGGADDGRRGRASRSPSPGSPSVAAPNVASGRSRRSTRPRSRRRTIRR